MHYYFVSKFTFGDNISFTQISINDFDLIFINKDYLVIEDGEEWLKGYMWVNDIHDITITCDIIKNTIEVEIKSDISETLTKEFIKEHIETNYNCSKLSNIVTFKVPE